MWLKSVRMLAWNAGEGYGDGDYEMRWVSICVIVEGESAYMFVVARYALSICSWNATHCVSSWAYCRYQRYAIIKLCCILPTRVMSAW